MNTLEDVLKYSDDLKIGDEFRIAGMLVRVEKKRVNDNKDLVLDLEIIGALTKKRSKMMLILPPQVPVVRKGDAFLRELSENMSVPERREYHILQRDTSRMWRNFWIKVAHGKGISNVAMAKEFELSEGTVRAILAKGK